jgi:flagellin
MAIAVQTNVSSINTTRRLNAANHKLDTSYQRLSSGMRINSAKDDAAGLQISNRMTTQINGYTQGNRNANDGIALAQTAEGALDEVTSMLQRIRTLAVQSANGTNTTADRQSIQAEVTALSNEITRIACQTTFGGKKILNGATPTNNNNITHGGAKAGTMTFQVGANSEAGDRIDLDLSQKFTVTGLLAKANNGSSIECDTNTANKTGVMKGGDEMKASGNDDARFSVTSQASAQQCIASIDKVIALVDSKRGEMGAVQNRLQSTISNQESVIENQSDARSRIRDTDYATEAAALSQQNIIQQAATSMLTQANSRPQLALSLLG